MQRVVPSYQKFIKRLKVLLLMREIKCLSKQ